MSFKVWNLDIDIERLNISIAMTILIQAAEHPIKSVTVFKSSKAEVVRTFNLSLQVRPTDPYDNLLMYSFIERTEQS